MDFVAFERLAHEIFRDIPEQFREGVDGLEVSRATVPHPSLPDVYTLGECKSEYYPTEHGGVGEVRSIVALYYGSFLELSRIDEQWDWEGEAWETITHEIRHHLESLAAEDDLEEIDYAEDQNFARHEGEPFDPFFYRLGERRAEGSFVVGGELFREVWIEPAEAAGEGDLTLSWEGRALRIPRPPDLGDVHFVHLEGLDEGAEAPVAVLLRRRGWRERIASLLRPAEMRVLQSEAVAQWVA